jgi:hypothetical protein
MAALTVLVLAGCTRGGSAEAGSSEGSTAAVVLSPDGPAAELSQMVSTPYFEATLLDARACRGESLNPGVERWGVELRIHARGPHDLAVSAFYATLRDSSGQRYESVLSGCTPPLPARTLRDGETARGWVSFDIPEGVHDLELGFEPNLIGIGRVRSAHRAGR